MLEQDKQSGQRQHSLICIFVNTIKNAINVHKFIKEVFERLNVVWSRNGYKAVVHRNKMKQIRIESYSVFQDLEKSSP